MKHLLLGCVIIALAGCSIGVDEAQITKSYNVCKVNGGLNYIIADWMSGVDKNSVGNTVDIYCKNGAKFTLYRN